MQNTENTKCLPPKHPKSGLLRLQHSQNTVNIWTSSFDAGWGAENVPRSLSSSNLGTAQWGLKPMSGLDFGWRHPTKRTLSILLTLIYNASQHPCEVGQYYYPHLTDGELRHWKEWLAQGQPLWISWRGWHTVGIHSILVPLPRAFYFLECTSEQKEASRYT